jgi:hypothetical protein
MCGQQMVETSDFPIPLCTGLRSDVDLEGKQLSEGLLLTWCVLRLVCGVAVHVQV